MWQEDYIEALNCAESVIGLLIDRQLGGYRALWEYLAGSAASMAVSTGNTTFNAKAREHFSRAKNAAKGIPWLVQISQFNENGESNSGQNKTNALIMLQVEKIEAMLVSLGTTHDRKYSQSECIILEGLNDPDNFEKAHKLLGEHLGYDAGKVEATASPDPWWQSGHICLVFEDHANANDSSSLDATKARQAASHPNWIRSNVPSCKSPDVEIHPILITPVSTVYPGILPHLEGVYLWGLDDFKQWAFEAMGAIREIRKTFVESGDLVWRNNAAELLQTKKIDVVSLSSYLKTQIANELLIER
jgi:hypothetical protein